MDKEFEEVYEFTNEKIVKEKEKIKEYKTDIRQSEALVVGIIIVCIIISLITKIQIAKYIFVTVAAMMLFFFAIYVFSNERKIIGRQNKFSDIALSELAVRIKDGFVYEKDAEISGTYYRKSGFNRTYNDLKSIGAISGSRNNHNITLSNIIVKAGNTAFKGIFTYAELNNSFDEIDLMRVNSTNNKKEKCEIPGTGLYMYSEKTSASREIIDDQLIEIMQNFYDETKIKYEIMINKGFAFFRFFEGDILTKPLANDKATKDFLFKYYAIIDFTSKVASYVDMKK